MPMSVPQRMILTLALLAAGAAPVAPARAEDKSPANSSSFRYVDEKSPARVYPVPPPDADPTGLSLEEVRARTTLLEERIERLEAIIASLQAEIARLTKPDAKEHRP